MNLFNHFPTRFTLSLTLILSLFVFNSCNSNDELPYDDIIIWDIAPLEAVIMITNQTNVNLLNPEVPGNLFGKKITVDYNGKTYDVQWDEENSTRAVLAVFKGLMLRKGYTVTDNKILPDPTKNFLTFGLFAGDRNQDISFILKIEDYPEEYHIELTNRIAWEKNNPVIDRSVKVNGKLLPSGMITITLP